LVCLIQERKTGDEIIETIESGLNQVLRVVAEQFHGGKHGKTAVPKLSFHKRKGSDQYNKGEEK
jgi:hypothetical protein